MANASENMSAIAGSSVQLDSMNRNQNVEGSVGSVPRPQPDHRLAGGLDMGKSHGLHLFLFTFFCSHHCLSQIISIFFQF